MRTLEQKQCETCKNIFQQPYTASKKKWATMRFCSYGCRRFTQDIRNRISATKLASETTVKGVTHHNYKDGSALQYKSTKRDGKMVFVHRYVMEQLIGRKLKSTEVVHHWDEDKKNNDISNLALFRSKSAHGHIHAFAKYHGIPVLSLKFEQPWLITHT